MSETNGTQISTEPEAAHKHELGAIVEVDVNICEAGYDTGTEVSLKGTCHLIVVGHIRDRARTPLYILSDLPVRYPFEDPPLSRRRLVYKHLATVVESGYGEESLRSTGKQVPLMATVARWIEAVQAED